jgi:ASC-1-like (ASCH) protein
MALIHSLTIKEKPFNWIKQKYKGKRVEVRQNIGRFTLIHAGDTLTFTHNREPLKCSVVAVRQYPSLADLVDSEEPAKIAPSYTRNAIFKAITQLYPNYTGEFVAIEFAPIK